MDEEMICKISELISNKAWVLSGILVGMNIAFSSGI